jgi:cysteine desulfurase
VIALDLVGVAVSAGAACSSGKVSRNHVLEAMNQPPEVAEGAIRVSLGWNSTVDDVGRFLEAWKEVTATRPASASVA